MKAGPHYNKLCSWVSNIGGKHRGHHIWSVMSESCPGETTFMILASSLSGKNKGEFYVSNQIQGGMISITIINHYYDKE